MRIALFIGQVAAEFADEDDLAVRKTRRMGFGAHHVIRCRGRGGIHALRRLEAEILREIAEGVHRVRNRVGEPIAAVNHLGGFAEQRSLPGDFSRPGPVGRHLVAAEVGADAVIPALLVPRLPCGWSAGGKFCWSPAYMASAAPICFKLLMQAVFVAEERAFAAAGSSMAARIAVMA